MYSPNTVIRLNEIAHRYRDLIFQAVHDVLSQERYRNTGAAAASLTVDVTDGDESKAPVIQVQFADYLIFLDKRKLQWTKQPDMKKLMEWAATKTDDKNEANRIAWGTAWKQKNFDTWKAKPWRKKSLSAVLKEMNELVLKAYDEVIEMDLQQAIVN